MMKGNWTGYYRHNSEWVREATGFEMTGFTIEIQKFEGINFEGIVNDDLATGGMSETGKIVGTVEGNAIRFKKYMPKKCIIYPNGTREKLDKKHSTLYYSGLLSDDRLSISGTWEFGWQMGFIFGLIPFPYKGASGTWSMTKKQ